MQFLKSALIPAALALSAACSSGPREGVYASFLIQEPGRSIAANAEAWTLYALNPNWPDQDAAPETLFHGHEILGTATLEDPAVMERLTAALNEGIDANDGTVAACFNPRHGISAVTPEGTVDLSICFECLQVYVYDGRGERVEQVLTMASPTSVFNEVYRAAGLEIAP